jgi:hypothetical protein
MMFTQGMTLNEFGNKYNLYEWVFFLFIFFLFLFDFEKLERV